MFLKRIVVFAFLFCFGISSIVAQKDWVIWGIVTDDSELTLPGAVVSINGNEKVLITDKEGVFRFNAYGNDRIKIEVSFMGYLPYSSELTRNLSVSPDTLRIVLQPGVQQLHEVVITDRYAEKRRKEEPKSVEVVNQEYIRKNQAGSLMKSLERLPGISTLDIGSGQSKPVIRGLGFNRVVVADHGVKHESQQWGADHGLEIDQYAVEQVEIIKGPGSLMYGSDAIGGLVDLTQGSIPERHSLAGSVNLNVKSNNGFLGGSANISGRKEKWYFKGRVTATDYADYRVPVNSVVINSYRVPLDKNRLRNTAGEEYDFHLTIGRTGNKFNSVLYLSNVFSKAGFFANAHGLMPLLVDSSYDRSNRDIQLPFQKVNHLKVINKSVLFVNDWKVESEIGFQNNIRKEFSRYIGHGYMPAELPDSLGFSSDLGREFRKSTYNLNLRLSIPAFSDNSLMIGFNAAYQHNRIGGWSFMIPSYDQINTGIFLIDRFMWSKRLLVLAGLRYDFGNTGIQSYTDWFRTPVISTTDTVWSFAQRAAEMNRRFHNLSWSLGISYATDNLILKTNVGKSFRMPIPKELAVNGVNYHYFIYEKGNPELDPEVSYQLDAGIEWHTKKFALEFSPFVNYFPNYIFLNPTYLHDYTYGAGNQVYGYTQSEVFRIGGELHVHYQLFARLKTGLIAEYIYSRQLSGDKKGFSLPFSPPPSLILNLKYSPTIAGSLHNSYISVDINLTGAQNQVVPPELKTPGFVDVSINLGTDIRVGKSNWMISILIDNLFNTVYYNHTSFYRQMDVPEPGRNFSLNIMIPVNLYKASNTNNQKP